MRNFGFRIADFEFRIFPPTFQGSGAMVGRFTTWQWGDGAMTDRFRLRPGSFAVTSRGLAMGL